MKKVIRIEPTTLTRATKKLRVAAYCRVSTGMEDQLVSLEVQKEHYESYIKSNPNWDYAGLYYDEGISGTKKEKRPALLQMIADCEDGKIDYIVTKSLSRFARNTTDYLELVRKLQDLGIPVYFEKENLDTGSMESELLLSIMSSIAEGESVSISENAKWGVRHRFETDTFKISYAPYGYSVKEGELFINEKEAEWVRYIFSAILKGKSTCQIAKELNEKNAPTRKGGPWTSWSVCAILKNEKYVGDSLFQKTYSDFQFQRHKNNGEREQFLIRDHHEGFISREDFERAQEVLNQHAKEKNIEVGTAKYNRRYAFSRRLFCGQCGSPLKRKIIRAPEGKRIVWSCKGHVSNKESCSMKHICDTSLEDAFCTMMNKLTFGRKQVLEELMDAIRGQSHKAGLRRVNEIDQILGEIAERLQNVTSIMSKGYIDPATYTRETNSLQLEAAALEAERERLTREMGGDMRKTQGLQEILKYTGKGEMLSEFAPGLFEQFVDHVTVCSREEVIFHLKCGLSLPERIE